jgi:hypothetical protein
VLPAEWQVIAFLPLVGNLALLLFGRDNGECSMCCGEGSLLVPKIAKFGA